MEVRPILVATDLKAGSQPAARWALALAERRGVPVDVAHIVELGFENWWKDRYRVANDPLHRAQAVAQVAAWFEDTTGKPPRAAHVEVTHCTLGLTQIAEALDPVCLVMAASEKGKLAEALAGSRVQELAARPPCPLVVVHPGQPFPDDLVIVTAVDLSGRSPHVARIAAEHAKALDAELHLLHAVHAPEVPAMPWLGSQITAEVGAAVVDDLRQLAAGHIDGVHAVRAGVPTQVLRDYVAEVRATLLMVGRTGHRTLIGDVLGSVPRSLLRALPCSLVVVPDVIEPG